MNIIYLVIYLIGEFVSLIGVLIGSVFGQLIVLIFNYISGFELHITFYEVLMLILFSLGMSILAFCANVKQLKNIELMSLFRN